MIYHDGWIAGASTAGCCGCELQAVPFGDNERWELYSIADDFSQGVDSPSSSRTSSPNSKPSSIRSPRLQ